MSFYSLFLKTLLIFFCCQLNQSFSVAHIDKSLSISCQPLRNGPSLKHRQNIIRAVPNNFQTEDQNHTVTTILGSKHISHSEYNNYSSIAHINAMMFFLFTTLGSSQPFLPIFYRRIGISDSRIGILGALNPLMIFLVSPLWGAFADKTGWYKEIMIMTFLGSLLSRLLLAFQFTNFSLLCLVITVSAILNAPVKPLMDAIVMSMLNDKSGI